jgi:ribosomal protein L37E
MIVNPLSLMVKYLDGQSNLTNDERELLLFALYCESRDRNDLGLAALATARLGRDGRMPVEPAITCPRCGSISYHPEDIRNRYCAACHRFHGEK